MKRLHADPDPFIEEYRCLVGQLGRVQRRCSDLFAAQAAEIERLRAEVMCLRGAVIARDTALAFAREERQELEASIPGLPRRVALMRRVETLKARVQELMRERHASNRAVRVEMVADLRSKAVLCLGSDMPEINATRTMVERAGGAFVLRPLSDEDDEAALEASLAEADLVICQTGCVSHDAYWRVQDHCRRTGKQCMLIDQPQVLHFAQPETIDR